MAVVLPQASSMAAPPALVHAPFGKHSMRYCTGLTNGFERGILVDRH
jgi:hypothetical protein